MQNNKICVYTAITGNYDNLKDVRREKNVDYYCFTNNKNLKSKTWKIIYLDNNEGLSNLLLARKYKILIPSMIRSNYDVSVWIDGSVIIKGSIIDFINKECDLDHYSLACFKHSQRNCVYEEAAAIIKFRKDRYENVIHIIDFLKESKYPEHNGLNETTVLVRKHDDKLLNKVLEQWYYMVENYSPRDQLSFNYNINKFDFKIKNINGIVFDNEYFGWEMHVSSDKLDNARIFFGKYEDIYEDKYIDVNVVKEDNKYTIKFNCLKTTDTIIINIGKKFGKQLKILNFDIFKDISVYPCINLSAEMIMGYDDVFIYITDDFKENSVVEIVLNITKMTDTSDQIILEKVLSKYHYDKIKRDNMIKGLSDYNSYLKNQYSYLEEHNKYVEQELNIFEKSLLCKLYRKIYRKFIR